jgi:alanyl aminopeptidase
MDSDSLLSARQIRQPITSNDDIVNAFDPITYAKGKAVLGMLEDWLGPAVFQRGLTRYLKTHAHGTAVADDFLRALTQEAEAAGKVHEAKRVAAVASSFLDQPGVPLVQLSLSCKDGPPRLRWSQGRYLPLMPAGADTAAEAARRYRLPLCFAVDREPVRCELLDGDRGEITLPACPQSVLADPQSRGYYRVQYDGALLDALVARAFPTPAAAAGEVRKSEPLSPVARLGFLRNLEAGLRRGDLPLARLLPLLPAMAADPSRHVVGLSAGLVTQLRDLVGPGQTAAWQAQVHDLYASRLRGLGLRTGPGDDDNTRILRSTILPWVLGDAGRTREVAALQAEGESLLSGWLRDRRALDAETAHALALAVPQQAGAGLWQAIAQAAKGDPDRVRRSVLFSALGSFRDPALAERSLALTLDPTLGLRETLPIVYRLAGFPETRDAAYAFVQKNLDPLVARLPRDGGAGLSRVLAGFCDGPKAAAAERFFAGRTTQYTGGPRILRQSSERAQRCAALRQVYAPQLESLLATPQGPSPATPQRRQAR